jgi:hypothetical protein
VHTSSKETPGPPTRAAAGAPSTRDDSPTRRPRSTPRTAATSSPPAARPASPSRPVAVLPPRRLADRAAAFRVTLASLTTFSRYLATRPLRPYQLEPGEAIARAVLAGQGGSFTVQMSRQAGKNELSAQLEAYLLTLHRGRGGSIVKCAPTFRPQILTSRLRLEDTLAYPLSEVTPVEPEQGYVLRLGRARAFFLSAQPDAQVVGATASLLLEVDEAQDVDPEKHDRDFAPMCASTNAVRAYYGTAGREGDLLESVKAANLEAERRDGLKRHFEYPWHIVAEHNPAYGQFVEAERARLGARHPVFLSQYELKSVAPLDALLDPAQLRNLQGDHPRLRDPLPDRYYVAGVDVAGPAELNPDPNRPRADHDSTVVVFAEVDFSAAISIPTYQPPDALQPDGVRSTLALPAVRVVDFVEWRGRSHQAQYADLLDLLGRRWDCRAVVFDATGLGAAPSQFLQARLGSRLIPFVFTSQSKSALAYDLLAAANAGQLSLYAAGPDDLELRACWAQLRATRRTISTGAQMSWSAAHGHDDYVAALALALHAAGRATPPAFGVMIRAVDPYADGGRY